MIKFLIFMIITSSLCFGQSYAPAPGNPGSTAIHMDSSIIIDWAAIVVVERGPMNILNPSAGLASYGTDLDGVGPANGIDVVSFGDGGNAIITFNSPITNGAGPDFAVFENGFTDHYMEFAFVEVSSDGINYFRFDAISEAPISPQQTNASFSNCAYIHNLAGKYRLEYGTPFDLDELSGIPGLNVDLISHIRLIDVVGSVNPTYGSYDSQGQIINDPFPTEFPSSGFDLDAIGVIHQTIGAFESNQSQELVVFPNPTETSIQFFSESEVNFQIVDCQGKTLLSKNGSDQIFIDLQKFEKGIYFLNVVNDNGEFFQTKFMKR